MGIRKKTSLSIFVAVVLSIGLFYQLAHHVIDNRFTNLERNHAHSNLNYALRLLEHSRDGLSLLVKDWSLWNDTYFFLENRNQAYIESNLVKETFSETGLSYIGFFPLEGKSTWEGYYDHTAQKMGPSPHALTQTLDQLVENLRERGAGAEVQPGFFVSQGTFHFIAASPILKSDESGPSRGWLVMVQQLHDNFFNGLFTEEEIKVTVATRPPAGNTETAHFHFDDEQKHYTCAGTLNDILGHPSIEVALMGPAAIVLAGRHLLALTGAGISAAGLLLGILTYFLIQRTLLKRILVLRRQVAPVAIAGAPVVNVDPQGNDELSDLAMDINGVFKRIIEEECLNRHILTSLKVGVLIIDAQSGKIRGANICMEEMTGIGREKLMGQAAHILFHPSPEDEQNPQTPYQEKGILKGSGTRQVIRTKTATRFHNTPIRIETFRAV